MRGYDEWLQSGDPGNQPDECPDCGGTGMVPSIGPEPGEVDGYVECTTCAEVEA